MESVTSSLHSRLDRAASKSLTETTPCPLCRSRKFEVLVPARYPENIPESELLKIYHSSSDRTLMDQLVRCEDCALIYLNPRVRSDIILDSYSSAVDPVFV